jgi:cytochrome c553
MIRFNKIIFTLPVIVAALSSCGGPGSEEPVVLNPEAVAAGKILVASGRDSVIACAGCHGENGEGNAELGNPRLAGLHPKYIEKQLHDFKRDPLRMGVSIEPIARDYSKTPRIYKDLTVYSPGTRHDAAMNAIAKEMTDEEIINVANYYGSLAFEATPVPNDFQSLERGLELAVRGKPEYMMPRCDACHGPRGEGFGEHFPPLAGQPIKYIVSQLNKWQNGKRDNDHLSMMKNTANLLTDADKILIAKYYANQSFKVNK